jgi:hypothetical protein
VAGGTLLGDTQPLTLDAYGGVDCVGTCIIDFNIECMDFYPGMLTLRWNCYGTYACIPGRVTITDSDDTGSRTRVYAISCVWASTTVPYLCQVMSASVPQGRGAGLAYPVNGSPQVGWFDAQVPPGSG